MSDSPLTDEELAELRLIRATAGKLAKKEYAIGELYPDEVLEFFELHQRLLDEHKALREEMAALREEANRGKGPAMPESTPLEMLKAWKELAFENDDAVGRAQATAARRLELLREVEWVYVENAPLHAEFCPLCGLEKEQRGHHKDCKLAKEIRDG
jgi:hypothetical protein